MHKATVNTFHHSFLKHSLPLDFIGFFGSSSSANYVRFLSGDKKVIISRNFRFKDKNTNNKLQCAVMVSIMKTKCTEDTEICLSKFRGFMEVAMFQLEPQSYRKRVGKWRKIFQAKGLYMQSHGVLRKIIFNNYFFSILSLNMYVLVTNSPPHQRNCLTFSIFKGQKLEKIYLYGICS